jgi:hypothetical protein
MSLMHLVGGGGETSCLLHRFDCRSIMDIPG